MPGTQQDVDFEAVVDLARTHSSRSPGSDTDSVTILTVRSLSADALAELADVLGGDAVDRGSLAYYLSPANGERLLESAGLESFDPLEERLGYPIKIEAAMPDDAVLLADPEAFDDEQLREPTAIACGTLESAW